MQRERVADDIYVFTSDLYAQVTAGAIVTPEGSILIDTLAFPEETRQIKNFLEKRLACPVRTVINTHYHADHTFGTYLFDNALVVSHALCRELLDTRGRRSIEEAKRNAADFSDVDVVLPSMVFKTGTLTVHLGNKTVELWHSPGHSLDSVVCYVKEDRVLFAADTLMPVPYFVDGSYEDFVASLNALRNKGFESVVQGHGEVVLRGEVESKLDSDLDYLNCLKKHVDKALTQKNPEKYLGRIDIEACGKSRIPLNGAVQDLHRANLRMLFSQARAAATPA
ncbi:MAG: MBL fold metallo-hydrolase [Anaerolineae bacterium]|nr:MBL fold metallo-hydrolase [Anaerolineae bacterium]